jgi:thiamine biosynthesis lipoprotein
VIKKNKIKLMIIIFFVIVISIVGIMMSENNFSDYSDESSVYQKTDILLDTVVTISIYDDITEDEAEKIIEECFDRISELQNILDVYTPGSDLYRIKENAGIEPTEVSDETIDIIDYSIYFSEISDGKFDVSAGPLIDLWHIDPPDGYVPTTEELELILPLVNYQYINIDKTENTVYLDKEDMIINLGAIAKGYIADDIKDLLLSLGINNAIINLGGNVLLVGDNVDEQGYAVGIQNPGSLQGEYIGSIKLFDDSIVTSGNYERVFEDEDGNLYHHILDPDTGFPSNQGLQQVTIITDKSVDADALSTTFFLLGIDKSIEYIDNTEKEIMAIFVTEDNVIYMPESLSSDFDWNETVIENTYTIEYY